MPNVCSITLQGHLGRDPEARYTASGTTVSNFSVAYTPKKDAETTWFRCVAFGKTAELIQQYCKKGSAPLLQGSITMRKYEKDGQQRESWEVTVDRVLWLGPKQGGGESTEPRQSQSKPEAAASSGLGNFDDDIPFMRFASGAMWRVI